ncbi:MAG TPA: hypothetical protein VK902_01470 [Rubrobacter sp.]|jgi:TolB protein|nr:hypothetical protein [Rubrobacter sp.]
MDIWVMNADGTNPVQLTNAPLPEVLPAWSPDGKKIAFLRVELSSGDGEIYVMNAGGGGERDLTNHPAFDFNPSSLRAARSIGSTNLP